MPRLFFGVTQEGLCQGYCPSIDGCALSVRRCGSTLVSLLTWHRATWNASRRAGPRQCVDGNCLSFFLQIHADLAQAIEEAIHARVVSPPSGAGDSPAKDQVIGALRRRMDEMKQLLAAKDQQLRGKQREIDLLYGKLAAASPLVDTEVQHLLKDALDRLARL